MSDPEIEAMSAVADALSALDDDDARSRVLRWAAEKYGVTLPRLHPNGATAQSARTSVVDMDSEDDAGEEINDDSQRSSANAASGSTAQFGHFAELFDAVQPTNDMERAMTAAYWEQVIRGKNDWQSATINRELKDLGHYVTAINKALSSGMQKKPALVLQLKKAGAAQQGRKTYKLSTEGLKLIRSRIAQKA